MTIEQDPDGRPAVRTESDLPAPSGGHTGYRGFATVLGGILMAPLAVIALLTLPAVAQSKVDQAAAARVVDAAELEEEYGIKVTLVAVTADGGLIDLRFTVSDKDKASHLMHDPGSMPSLFVQQSGRVLSASHPLAHKVTVLDGASYFLLYPNSGGAIQGGTPVSVVIDGLRSPPILAQS